MRKTFFWITLVLGALFLLKCAVQLWALDRGFDMSDEALYLLWAKYFGSYRNTFYYFHVILRGIFFFVTPDIISYRLLRIFLEISGLLIFSAAAIKWCRSQGSLFNAAEIPFGFLFLFGALGSFLSVFSRAASYNDVTNFNILASAGTMLCYLSYAPDDFKSRWKKYLLAALTGTALGMQFFVKSSSAVIQLAALTLLLLLYHNGFWKEKVKAVAAILFGGVMSGILFFVIYGRGIETWYNEYLEGFRVIATQGYTFDRFVWLYFQYDFVNFLKFFSPAAAVFAILFVAFRKSTVKNPGSRDLYLSLSVVVSAVVFAATAGYWDFIGYEDLVLRKMHFSILFTVYAYPLVIFILLLLVITESLSAAAHNHRLVAKNIMVIAVVILLPYIMLAGTDTSLVKGVYGHLIPWFVLIGMGVCYLIAKLKFKFVSVLILLIVVGLSQYHFIDGYIYRQYRLLEDLTKQKNMLQNSSEKIFFDEATYRFLREMKSILANTGFTKNDPVIALTDMPGVVYYLEGFSPGTPWYFQGRESIEFNCFHLTKNLGKLDKPPVILINQNVEPENLECLSAAGIGFPQEYFSVGEAWNPFSKTKTFVLVRTQAAY